MDFHFSCMNYGYYCLLFNTFSYFKTVSRDETRQPWIRLNRRPEARVIPEVIAFVPSTG
jgi:hypothetical protein